MGVNLELRNRVPDSIGTLGRGYPKAPIAQVGKVAQPGPWFSFGLGKLPFFEANGHEGGGQRLGCEFQPGTESTYPAPAGS
jgi:hypothetical protein